MIRRTIVWKVFEKRKCDNLAVISWNKNTRGEASKQVGAALLVGSGLSGYAVGDGLFG